MLMSLLQTWAAAMRSRAAQMRLLGVCAAAAIAAAGLASTPALAQQACSAQFDLCKTDAEARRDACRASCAAGDNACQAQCNASFGAAMKACAEERRLCRAGSAPIKRGAGADPGAPATRGGPPRGAPAASAPAARSASPGRIDEASGETLQGRVYFLTRSERQEPQTPRFFGYLVIGPQVSIERKLAVARGVACNLYFVKTAEEVAQIEAAALMVLPARRTPEGRSVQTRSGAPAYVVSSRNLLAAYDDQRAARWLAAASRATGENFDVSQAVLFIGSRSPRVGELDVAQLSPADATLDPMVADASDLSPRYLEHWANKVVEGMRQGRIQSEQDYQQLMGLHSWIESLGGPISGLFSVRPAVAGELPAGRACPELQVD